MTTLKTLGLLVVMCAAAAQTSPEHSSDTKNEDTTIGKMQKQYAEQEARVAELAVRVTEDPSNKTRQQLRAAVERSFRMQTYLQQHRITEARKRLDVAETRLKQRRTREETIVTSRLERLSNARSGRWRSAGSPRETPRASTEKVTSIITEAASELANDLKRLESEYEEFLANAPLSVTLPVENNPRLQGITAYGAKLTELQLEQTSLHAKRRTLKKCEDDFDAALEKGDEELISRRETETRSILAEHFTSLAVTLPQQRGPGLRNVLGAYGNSIALRLATIERQVETLEVMKLKEVEKVRAERAEIVRKENFAAAIARKRQMHTELVKRLREIRLAPNR